MALAFHPSYSTNGLFFVAYTAPRNGDATGSNLVLEKFSVSPNNPDLANSASGVILLTISHPVNSNHNGGTLAFGGDGYLYWSTGDGGSGGDPPNNAQQLNNMLGKILRIDVNSGSPYGIPTSNPFYSSINPNIKKEIWAYGLRNPWRISFDSLTHDLYIGDVGQSAREEVDFQAAGNAGGQNYGWRVMEGSICYNPSSGCDQSGKILPVAEYDHTLGCSITGGYVYRGLNFPSLVGYYFYGDYCSGRLFSLYNDPILGWTSVQLLDTPFSISTFGEDEQGELYLADLGTGKLYNIRYQDTLIVTSIVRADPNPTNATSVNFTVTFSKDVTNVDMAAPFSDFALTTSPSISGVSITGVSGSGATYTVTVNTGSGNGTIRLDVIDNDTIIDDVGHQLGGTGINNGNFTSGEFYKVHKSGGDTVGTFRPSNATFYLRNSNSDGAPDITVQFGAPGDYPVVGDWDGNGTDTIGVYRNGVFYLSNSNTTGHVDLTFAFGKAGDQPIAGDWNGDGIDTIGVYRNSKITFLLRNTNSAGAADATFKLGIIGDVGIAGDWNADGKDTTGVFRPSNGALYLKNANTTGYADIVITYGVKNDKPVTGDWNSDGTTTIGIYRNAQFYLRNTNTKGYADFHVLFGAVGDMPLAGNWDGIP